MIQLSQQTLNDLPATVSRPRYDRSLVTCGIVHFGVGGFHRAHQALAVDTLMNQGHSFDWGICGVGTRPEDAQMRDVLRAQDYLYTVVERDADGSVQPQVIGSIIDYLFAPDDPEAVVERMVDPKTRIVSLTITEGGYNTNFITGEFDLTNPEVAGDLMADVDALRTPFGLITEALARRRSLGQHPFTILSCDNIQDNGRIAKEAFLAYAGASDPGLADWIRESVAFPATMVDRITPATTDDDRDFVRQQLGFVDDWPVVCEPFFQWVIEDEFTTGRPRLDVAGAQFVDDVRPYELMKLRLLNVSYVGVGHLGALKGYQLAYQSAQDAAVARFLRAYMNEVSSSLRPVPGVDLDVYKDQLIARFSNKYVKDTIRRLSMEGSDRLPKWLLPAVWEMLADGHSVRYSAGIIAVWARFAEGVDERGHSLEVVDRLASELVARASEQRLDNLAFLRDQQLFGEILEQPEFTTAYTAALSAMHRNGVQSWLQVASQGLQK
ncbi:mannitol dehydrogenase family protein [Microbacterium sp. YY-01]|uniref:mannitol dehydrogenase family protein n=1 Tax=Microbacterium sp. YY-01 TaxID=3421634 RepID=UPI003D17B098